MITDNKNIRYQINILYVQHHHSTCRVNHYVQPSTDSHSLLVALSSRCLSLVDSFVQWDTSFWKKRNSLFSRTTIIYSSNISILRYYLPICQHRTLQSEYFIGNAFFWQIVLFDLWSSRIRHTPKTTRAYESSDGGTPSPARFRSKRNCNNNEIPEK